MCGEIQHMNYPHAVMSFGNRRNEKENVLLRAVEKAKTAYESAPAGPRLGEREAFRHALHELNEYLTGSEERK